MRLALALFLSGAGALACETVWLRMLSRSFGVTVHAVAALVALYMGGLAVGAALAGRLKARPGAAYAALEAAAAALSLAATWAMIRLPEVVARLGGEEPLSPWLRAALAAPLLLPPTILLGATLPVAARAGSARLLYASNTLGACAGTLAAGFWLIGAWGETATVAAAAGLGLAAAVLGWTARGRAPAETTETGPRWVLAAYALSGFCALGYEVLWTRQLIPMLGNSVYAFTLILAAYLLGIALGAAAPLKPSFGAAQSLTAAAALAALAAFGFLGRLESSPDFLYSPIRDASHFALLASDAMILIFPLAFCLGLMLPAALRLFPSVGPVYAANTAGGILGSLAVGFWGVEALGTWNCFLLLAAVNAALGLWLTRSWKAAAALLVAGLLVRGDPTLGILTGRLQAYLGAPPKVLFHEDTAAASVTGYASEQRKGLLINGIVTAGMGLPGALMALVPHLLLEKATPMLVICFGAGNTFRTAAILGGEVEAADLVPALFKAMPHFYDDAARHLAGRRLYAEDGRHLLLRRDRRYRAIIVDAAPPLFAAGAVNLYTREFFRLVDARLEDDGMFLLWLPLPGFEEDYWRILSALTEVFPYSYTWSHGGQGGFFVFGSRAPLGAGARELRERLKKVPEPWARHLSVESVQGGFLLSGPELRRRAARWPALTDDKPVVEFPLPRFAAKAPVIQDAGFLVE